MDSPAGRRAQIVPILLSVSFTCVDCHTRLTRFVRGDPADVWRCLPCDAALTQHVSEHLLDQVFGATDA